MLFVLSLIHFHLRNSIPKQEWSWHLHEAHASAHKQPVNKISHARHELLRDGRDLLGYLVLLHASEELLQLDLL